MARAVAAAAALLLLPMLGGCLDAMDEYYAFDPDQHYRNPGVFEGQYRFGNGESFVLEGGPYKASAPEIVRLVSERPATTGPALDAANPSVAYIPMAIWRPDNLTGPMPIVVDAGPYYEVGQHCEYAGQDPCRGEMLDDTIDWPGQSNPFLLDNVLPHGYAIVQLAVRGTGTAGGCMDLMGPDEQHDLDQALRWLGEQPWSNGRIGMMGVSYDGSTPWVAAATGNPYLKTIVPISGLPDIYDLMFHNGSAETRGVMMHSLVYGPYGFDDDMPQDPGVPQPLSWPAPPAAVGQANGREPYQDIQNLCPSLATGTAMGPTTTFSGDRHDEATAYWAERDHRAAVLQNYEGSVFLVHGLQDWNVDPHAAIPFNAALRAKGLVMKEWYGQWDHATPSSRCAQAVPEWAVMPCRLDYAEVLLRWFERELKGDATVDVGPAVQVQDNVGFWRNAPAYPDPNAAWRELRLSADGVLSAEGGEPARVDLMPASNGAPAKIVELRSEPLADDLHLSGLPQLKLPFETQGPGGEIAAWLLDEAPDGKVRAPFVGQDTFSKPRFFPAGVPIVGHAQMNLRYHAGGDAAQTVVPGTQYVAQIEFEPLEVLVPKGHRLVLWVFQFAYPDHAAQNDPAALALSAQNPVTIVLGPDAVLRLPTVDVDPRTVFPVPGAHFPSRDNLSAMYVLKPLFDSSVEAPLLPSAGPAVAPAPTPTPSERRVQGLGV